MISVTTNKAQETVATSNEPGRFVFRGIVETLTDKPSSDNFKKRLFAVVGTRGAVCFFNSSHLCFKFSSSRLRKQIAEKT